MKTLAISLITLASACSAPVTMADAWSLDSCISYAVSHNISLKQQQLRVEEGEQAITEAKDGFLPQIGVYGSQSFSFGRGLTAENTYANRNTSSTSWGVNLSLPLFQGTKEYKRVKIARLSLQQYVLDCEAAKDNLALNIISQYLQVLYAKEVHQAALRQASYSEYELTRQKDMAEAGKVAEATVYDLESVAAQDKLQVVTSANDVQTALVNLANSLQLPSVSGFDVQTLPTLEPSIPSAESVYASARESNFSVLGAKKAIEIAKENIALSKAGYIPTLSFSGGIGSSYYQTGGMMHENFGQQMKHNFSQSLGFSLNIPIFDGFTTRNSVRRAKLQEINSQLALEQRETDLFRDIQLAYYQAKGAKERYLTAGETLEKTNLSFESTAERFNLGRATQADYEQAKNNLFKTEVSKIQARYEYLIRHKILLFYANPGQYAKPSSTR